MIRVKRMLDLIGMFLTYNYIISYVFNIVNYLLNYVLKLSNIIF